MIFKLSKHLHQKYNFCTYRDRETLITDIINIVCRFRNHSHSHSIDVCTLLVQLFLICLWLIVTYHIIKPATGDSIKFILTSNYIVNILQAIRTGLGIWTTMPNAYEMRQWQWEKCIFSNIVGNSNIMLSAVYGRSCSYSS
jgi:hypothetical protein